MTTIFFLDGTAIKVDRPRADVHQLISIAARTGGVLFQAPGHDDKEYMISAVKMLQDG